MKRGPGDTPRHPAHSPIPLLVPLEGNLMATVDERFATVIVEDVPPKVLLVLLADGRFDEMRLTRSSAAMLDDVIGFVVDDGHSGATFLLETESGGISGRFVPEPGRQGFVLIVSDAHTQDGYRLAPDQARRIATRLRRAARPWWMRLWPWA
jgi:hypothetical protein